MFYCTYFSNKTVYLASCKIVLKLVTRLEHDIDDMREWTAKHLNQGYQILDPKWVRLTQNGTIFIFLKINFQ